MMSIFKKAEIKELSFSLFGVGATVGKKNDVCIAIDKQEDVVKQEVLRELFIIRNSLSDLYFRYDAIDEILINFVPDDEERIYKIANRLFGKVFGVYAQISAIIFGSKYFVLLEVEERSKVIDIFDYVLFEKAMMEENKDYFLDPDEQVSLVFELKKLFEDITNQINLISDRLRK